MYIDDYKRWLSADLEDPALTDELRKIEGQDNEIKELKAMVQQLMAKQDKQAATK